MADVDVQVQYTTTERKTRKVKKTSKRRESKDGDVAVTEVEQTNTTNVNDDGYVLRWPASTLGPRAVRCGRSVFVYEVHISNHVYL